MANFLPVHHVSHLHARTKLVPLSLHSEDRNLTRLQVVENFLRQILQRTRRQILKNPGVIWRTEFVEFGDDRGGNLKRHFVGDDANFLLALHSQAHLHCVARAGRIFGIERNGFARAPALRRSVRSGRKFRWFRGNGH